MSELVYIFYLIINIVGGGGRRKAKAKFSFPCHSDKKDLSLAASDSNKRIASDNIAIADEIGAATDDEMDNFMADWHDNQIPPSKQGHEHDTRGHSMAEILSGYLKKNDLQEGSSELVSLFSIYFSSRSTV